MDIFETTEKFCQSKESISDNVTIVYATCVGIHKLLCDWLAVW